MFLKALFQGATCHPDVLVGALVAGNVVDPHCRAGVPGSRAKEVTFGGVRGPEHKL